MNTQVIQKKKQNFFSIKIILFFLLTATVFRVQANVSDYLFSSRASNYVPITGGSVLSAAGIDNNQFPNKQIGFSFTFNNQIYNVVNVSANGYIWFGSVAPAVSNYKPISTVSTVAGFVCAFARDLKTPSTNGIGDLRIQTLGSSPNAVCIIQWKNFQNKTAGNTSEIFNFQIRLNQKNNSVEVVYGTITPIATKGVQVGLRGGSNSDFNNRKVTASNVWNNSVAGINNFDSCIYNQSGLKPAIGLDYLWTPTSADLIVDGGGGTLDTTNNTQRVAGGNLSAIPINFSHTDVTIVKQASLQYSVKGVQQPSVPLTLVSGDSISGIWQGNLPPISVIEGEVIYYADFVNQDNFISHAGIIAYDIGYLKLHPDAGKVVPVDVYSTARLQANPTVSSIKFTEITQDMFGTGRTTSYPSYFPISDENDLIEIENLGFDNAELTGYKIEVLTAVNYFTFTFPGLTVFGPNAVSVLRVGADATESNDSINNFFILPGAANTMEYNTPAGYILRNPSGDIIDAVATNNFKFPASANIPTYQWYGKVMIDSVSAGVIRTSRTDHDASIDWISSTSGYAQNIGFANTGLYGAFPAPSITWSAPGVPYGYSGDVVYVSQASPFNYLFNIICTDGISTTTASSNLVVSDDYTSFCVTPGKRHTTNITHHSVTLSWDATVYADSFLVKLKRVCGNDKRKIYVAGGMGTSSVTVNNLFSGSKYRWKIRAICHGVAQSRSCAITFITNCHRLAGEESGSDLSLIQISPNPTHQNLRVKFDAAKNQSYKLYLSDVTGREIYSSAGMWSEGENETEISLEQFKKGIYFLRILSDNQIFSERIVKN
ncbi:MAG: T9SS type A sorting domain-containing protein [Bacteroidia bacterium]